MLPSSQVNTNPFESIPNDPSRSTTPAPAPSPNDSSSVLSPRTPNGPPVDDAPLITAVQSPDQPSSLPSRPTSHSFSSTTFVSSPLNPSPLNPNSSANSNTSTTSPYPLVRPRPVSKNVHLSRIPSEDSQALGSQLPSTQRGSMVLWHLAAIDDKGGLLPPPSLTTDPRISIATTGSGESVWTLSSDSKYPSTTIRGGLVPYAWDPSVDGQDGADEHDPLHDGPESDDKASFLNRRSILNLGVLVVLISALLALFIALPVVTFVEDSNENTTPYFEDSSTSNNIQVPRSLHVPQLVDPATPESVKTRVGYDGQNYLLVFSDEFNVDNRTFGPGNDPFWEAVDLEATVDHESYHSGQVYTANGSLHIRIDNDGMQYRSGMLQSWNKFCFTGGYIEVALTLPGPDEETRGYSPRVWTMGNLARAGYGATTDGVWPYSYDSCDVGTFPNQADPDGLGPAAALDSSASQVKYEYKRPYLSGQRLSACTCRGEDHPGPSHNKGRGAPEIDVLEAVHNKQGSGGVVSQSAQFAPFTHGHLYDHVTDQDWMVYNTTISRPNAHKGSAAQQAVSGLTDLPSDSLGGPGQVFHTFGFEYFASPQARSEGFITWQMDNTRTIRMGAGAVGPGQGPDGSGIGQRLISEEPMSIVLNLGLSQIWQGIDLTTKTFPFEMLVDYVRVYQREGLVNIGCDPVDHPTAQYIQNHYEAYSNPQLKYWDSGPAGANYSVPKNQLYNDDC